MYSESAADQDAPRKNPIRALKKRDRRVLDGVREREGIEAAWQQATATNCFGLQLTNEILNHTALLLLPLPRGAKASVCHPGGLAAGHTWVLLNSPAPSSSSSCEGIINIDQNVNVLSISQIDRALCEMQYRAALNRSYENKHYKLK